MDNNLREVMDCTCLRIRRTCRRMTQVYEQALAGIDLTINQFVLSDRLGTDPTTLNRTLKPLAAKGLVKNSTDPADGRVRVVRITEKGKYELLKAIPLWRQAQRHVESALGQKTASALNELLDRCGEALASAGDTSVPR
jgi:DNA-binding MarR family transcriptional regulator